MSALNPQYNLGLRGCWEKGLPALNPSPYTPYVDFNSKLMAQNPFKILKQPLLYTLWCFCGSDNNHNPCNLQASAKIPTSPLQNCNTRIACIDPGGLPLNKDTPHRNAPTTIKTQGSQITPLRRVQSTKL